jgi:hypothetical protein
MVFSTTAAAFLHLDQHEIAHTHQTDFDAPPHHNYTLDLETEHLHHFNLHVIGDLVEHGAMSFVKTSSLFNSEPSIELIFRSYTPPIPPP